MNSSAPQQQTAGAATPGTISFSTLLSMHSLAVLLLSVCPQTVVASLPVECTSTKKVNINYGGHQLRANPPGYLDRHKGVLDSYDECFGICLNLAACSGIVFMKQAPSWEDNCVFKNFNLDWSGSGTPAYDHRGGPCCDSG